MMRQLRNLVFRLHKWLGLHIAFFFCFMFVTGAILALSDEVEKMLHPDIRVAAAPESQSVSFGQIFDAVTAGDPDATPYIIDRAPIAGAGDRTLANDSSGNKFLYWTDPATAKILDVTSQRNFKEIVKELHDRMMTPSRYVYVVVSATSFVLLYSVLSGLIAYRRFWRGYFRAPGAKDDLRKRWGGWHRLLGIWLAPFLLIVGLTGAYYFLGGLKLNGTVPQPALTEARETQRPAGFDGALIDAALDAASRAYPDFHAKSAYLPGDVRQGIRFAGDLGAPSRLVAYTVSVHPETLAVLGMVSTADNGGLSAISELVNVLHFGTWGGDITRYLWSVLGGLSAVLVMAGAVIYAARTTHNRSGSPMVTWRGMGVLRWGYVAFVLGILAMFILRVVF